MNAWFRSIFVVMGAFILAFTAQSQRTKNILVLHMESSHLPANVVASKAIQEVLGSRPGYQIFDEYMDENRLGSDYQVIANTLSQKYAGQKVDLVVTFGPQAFACLQLYGEKLWPGTPKVFSGIEARELPAALHPNTTGVTGSFDFSPTIDLRSSCSLVSVMSITLEARHRRN